MSNTSKKPMKILGWTLLVYALLVSTHLGEFWPLSIYPMFSQAGNPWDRALVREIPDTADMQWESVGIDHLAGNAVAVKDMGVDQIDYSNFVSKTKTWTPKRINSLRYMFGEQNIKTMNLGIYKVSGRLTSDDSVLIEYQPYFLFTADTTLSNPNLQLNGK